MSEPVMSTQHPFIVKINNNILGGSYDNISAVTIACCVAQLFLAATGGSAHLPEVTVEDETGTVIAVVGPEPQST